MIKISPISLEDARAYLEKHSAFKGEFNEAIAAKEDGVTKGVVVAQSDGKEFRKAHISTDGSQYIGSLLYGAMVRLAMAKGYETLIL